MLCNEHWNQLFSSAIVRHLTHIYSTHCPLLLQFLPVHFSRLGSRPFRFQAAWMRHGGVFSWMREEWACDGCLTTSLQTFARKLEWNLCTFGYILKRKKRNLLRMEGVIRAMKQRCSKGLLWLEKKLRLERQEILLQEELLWKQKSRCDWLRAGDGNTRFFHASTLIRRRKNHVHSLLNDRGSGLRIRWNYREWPCNSIVNSSRLILTLGGGFICGRFPPISNDQQANLSAPYSMEDTKKALMFIGSFKAPGPDGF